MTRKATPASALLVLALALAACSPSTVPSVASVPSVAPATPSPSPDPTATPDPTPTATPTAVATATPTPTPKPTPKPTGSTGSVPPPSLDACPYVDVATAHASYDDYATTLVDTYYRLPTTYAPTDLVSTSKSGMTGGFLVRNIILPDLTAMVAAAKAAGAPLDVESAYRSYANQKSTFNYWVGVSGYKAALLYSARPGHSEHQLGTTLDFKSLRGGSPFGTNWAKSPAGAWMMQHAWEYGFVLSYPQGKTALTCYTYEPWHYRWFGKDVAAQIHDSGLTTREWLWTHQ